MYVCMCVLTINGGEDVSGLPSFVSIQRHNTIILMQERPYTLKKPLLNS